MRPFLVALVIFVAACGGADSATTLTDAPVETIIPDDAELRRNIYHMGVNGVGTFDLPEERWVELAEAGCRQGAWDWGVARVLGEQFLAQYDPEGATEGPVMAQTVWLMTILGCRDLFPLGAIDRGPPPPVGP